MPTFDEQHRYSEASHQVSASVDGAEPMSLDSGSGHPLRPERITVTYRWRTQLGHTGWRDISLHLVGPYLPRDGEATQHEGTARLIPVHLDTMPVWVREFVDAHYPNHIRLVTDDAPPVDGAGERS